MESLATGVPVILGPIYDFNRIAVDLLKDNTGWVHILEREEGGGEFCPPC